MGLFRSSKRSQQPAVSIDDIREALAKRVRDTARDVCNDPTIEIDDVALHVRYHGYPGDDITNGYELRGAFARAVGGAVQVVYGDVHGYLVTDDTLRSETTTSIRTLTAPLSAARVTDRNVDAVLCVDGMPSNGRSDWFVIQRTAGAAIAQRLIES